LLLHPLLYLAALAKAPVVEPLSVADDVRDDEAGVAAFVGILLTSIKL
jgi:hypothetical protein